MKRQILLIRLASPAFETILSEIKQLPQKDYAGVREIVVVRKEDEAAQAYPPMKES